MRYILRIEGTEGFLYFVENNFIGIPILSKKIENAFKFTTKYDAEIAQTQIALVMEILEI